MTAEKDIRFGWEHYRRDREPRSSGRVLLSQALETHTLLNWGLSGNEIADAFEPHGSASDRVRVALAVRLFEAPLQDGRFRSWARPFGGGGALPLEPCDWEIDDFMPRFATSALDMDRPFDCAAPPNHWIFVEDEVIEALHDLHRADVGMPRRARAARPQSGAVTAEVAVGAASDGEALVRLPEVERLVGLKKSTIYARIDQGRFPSPVRNGERISSWRLDELREWIRDPR